jgi:hypothetical protein
MGLHLYFLIPALALVVSCSSRSEKQASENPTQAPQNRDVEQRDAEQNPNPKTLSDADARKVLESYIRLINGQRLPSDCSGDPVDDFLGTAKQFENALLDAFPVSESDEIRYGGEFHQNIARQMRLADSDPRRNKPARMADKMLPFRKRKALSYTVHLVDDDKTINAFAILGGHLYVTTGLLNFVDSDDELAGIIGHEIAHVDRKHCVRKVQKFVLANQALGEWGILAANIQMIVSAPFGQEDEYDADRGGAYFAHKAGYNPRKMKDFFVKLKEKESYNQLEKLIRTHPYSEQREKCLERYISNELGL